MIGKLSSILLDYYSQLSQATSVYDILIVVQMILAKYKYPNSIAKLVITKSGNMDFKEVNLPPHLRNIRVILSKEIRKPSKGTTPTKGEKSLNVGAVSTTNTKTESMKTTPPVSQTTPSVSQTAPASVSSVQMPSTQPQTVLVSDVHLHYIHVHVYVYMHMYMYVCENYIIMFE